jgi:hypothetical protein
MIQQRYGKAGVSVPKMIGRKLVTTWKSDMGVVQGNQNILKSNELCSGFSKIVTTLESNTRVVQSKQM